MIYFYDLIVEVKLLQILILTFYLIFIFIVCLFYKRKKNKKQYFRDIPDDLPIVVLKYYSDGKFSSKSVWLILLDLIRRDYYKLEWNKDKTVYKIRWNKHDMFNLKEYNLYSFEERLVKYINTYLINNKENSIDIKDLFNQMKLDPKLNERIDEIYDNLKSEVKNCYGLVSYVKNYEYAFLTILVYFFIIFQSYNYILLGIIYSGLILLISTVLKNIKFNLNGIIMFIILLFSTVTLLSLFIPMFLFVENGILLLILYFNPLLFIVITQILKLKMYEKKQKELLDKINGLKMFMKDFSNLKDKPMSYIEFYEEYYVLAEALGVKINDKKYINYEYDDKSFESIDAIDYVTIFTKELRFWRF